MKGPGIKDYLQILQTKKQAAHDKGLKFIEINSKELHGEVSPNHATMPTCCQAIYKLLLNGDVILQRPKGTTGFGSHLTVRYYLCNLIKSWLSEHGWEYVENKDYIEAHNDKGRWIINVQGIKRGRKQTLPVKLSEVMKHMDDTDARYSIAFNDSITYRRQWNEIPVTVKEKLNMSVILADKKGNIVEL